MGKVVRSRTNELIPLALSSSDGTLFDATTYIAGQEGGAVVPDFHLPTISQSATSTETATRTSIKVGFCSSTMAPAILRRVRIYYPRTRSLTARAVSQARLKTWITMA